MIECVSSQVIFCLFVYFQIKAMFPLVEEVLKKFEKYIDDNLKDSLEAREICAKFTTDVVSSCIFNADAQSFTKDKPEIREVCRKLFEFSPMFIILSVFYTLFPFLQKVYRIKILSQATEDFFTNLMSQAVEQRKKDKIERDDYLAFLINLRNKKQLKDVDMAAHGVTFFIDGFETSSLTIAHALFEVANNPKVQDKLRSEVNKIFDSNGKIDHEKLIENEYLDQVFYETLRMHSQANFLNRECSEDVVLTDSTGKTTAFKKDDSVNILVYSLHRDPEHFTNPDQFNPERFNSENGGVKAFRERGVFLPFGDGPRIVSKKFSLILVE